MREAAMARNLCFMICVVFISSALALHIAEAQDRAMGAAPAFNGGVFVTPVAGASFSAVAVQGMIQILGDGTSFQRKTSAFIARDYRGRIHNESHEIIPMDSGRQPTLLSVHIYDPDTRLNTFLNLGAHIARQATLPNPPSTAPPSNWAQQGSANNYNGENLRLEDLGSNVLDGIAVHGYRRAMTLGPKASGTGQSVVITDEYWYSEELRINMLAKHNDPRTGTLTITVTQVNRNEPPADLFEIPPGYKLVDVSAAE
jgi:hypothetical protein